MAKPTVNTFSFQLSPRLPSMVTRGFFGRRPSPEPDHYGSQSAVLLFILAAILTVHGLGLLRYHPNPAEIEAARQ